MTPPTSGIPPRIPLLLLRLALPIIASMVSRTVMSFVDFVMVSQLGTEAQAAILPAGFVLWCVISFGMGVVTLVNTFVAQALGRGRPEDCAAYAWNGVHLSIALGVLLLPAWFLVPPLFAWIDHPPNVQAMEIQYAQIGVLGIGPTIAAVALANFFNGIHRPMIGLYVSVIANAFNILANYVLIFGHFGIPAMGIAGAAWATAIASLLQMAIMLYWMMRPQFHAVYHTRIMWRLNPHHLRLLLWIGTPIGLQNTLEVFCWTIFTLFLVGRFGTVHLAANNLSFKLLEISFMPAVGLGVAITSAVGRCIGEGRHDLARLYVAWGRRFALIYMGSIGLLYLLIPNTLAGLLTADPAVQAVAARLLLFCAVFQLFDALFIIHSSALRGAGDTHWPAWISSISSLVLLIGGGFLIARVAPHWESYGVWAVATGYTIGLGVVMWLRWVLGPWEKIELLGKARERESLVASD